MKRFFRIAKKIIIGTLLTVVGAVGLDMGIRIHNAERKPLTEDQIAKAKSVFGDAVDYSKVRIAFAKISYFEPEDVAVTLGNTIYFPPEKPAPPPALPPVKKAKGAIVVPPAAPVAKAPAPPVISVGYTSKSTNTHSDLLIHEMTHVWQNQNHVPHTGVPGGIGLWLSSMFNKSKDVYAYTLVPGKKLTDYNMEQQARIVENNYVIKTDTLLKKTVETAIKP